MFVARFNFRHFHIEVSLWHFEVWSMMKSASVMDTKQSPMPRWRPASAPAAPGVDPGLLPQVIRPQPSAPTESTACAGPGPTGATACATQALSVNAPMNCPQPSTQTYTYSETLQPEGPGTVQFTMLMLSDYYDMDVRTHSHVEWLYARCVSYPALPIYGLS